MDQRNLYPAFSLHGTPVAASKCPATTAFKLHFDELNLIIPQIVVFCEDHGIASDIADAINAVLAKHSVRPAALAEVA